MIVLDTNIISEAWRPNPDPAVMAWLNAQAIQNQYICTPVIAELRYGIERLATSPRKQHLSAAVDRLIEGYRGRVLNFDVAAAMQFGRISATRARTGRRLEPTDAMIAAIALGNRMALATRDTEDFLDIGLELIDPFAVGSVP
jgi:predicted nucleic acid-binding protein